jgi:hypothetical protein
VITPRPGWQNRLPSANPFLMRGRECKSSADTPENSLVRWNNEKPGEWTAMGFENLQRQTWTNAF